MSVGSLEAQDTAAFVVDRHGQGLACGSPLHGGAERLDLFGGFDVAFEEDDGAHAHDRAGHHDFFGEGWAMKTDSEHSGDATIQIHDASA